MRLWFFYEIRKTKENLNRFIQQWHELYARKMQNDAVIGSF